MKKLAVSTVFLWICMVSAVVEKSLVVIVPSYNNEKYVEKNLNSLYDQEYDNYRVIYIDDCSTDKTLQRVRDLVAQKKQEQRTTIIHNNHNCGAMANFYHTVHDYCDDDDIVVQVDGDDSLKHTKVLARVNQEYSNPDVWLTNGRYMSFPDGKLDTQRRYSPAVIHRCAYREVERVPSHLRTCYAGLFKRIKLQDLLYQGDFVRMTCDFAMLFPLLEMAGNHIGFIDEVLYEYNCTNPLNDFKKNVVLQLHLNYVLRSRPKYQPLASRENPSQKLEPAVFIVGSDQGEIDCCKRSLQEKVKGLGEIQAISAGVDAKDLKALIADSSSDYVCIVDAKKRCVEVCDATDCTRALAQTKAHVFCLDRSPSMAQGDVKTFVTVDDVVSGWQFALAEHAWRKPFGGSAHIYAKKTFIDALSRVEKKSGNVFDMLNGLLFDMESVGLCLHTPIINHY